MNYEIIWDDLKNHLRWFGEEPKLELAFWEFLELSRVKKLLEAFAGREEHTYMWRLQTVNSRTHAFVIPNWMDELLLKAARLY